VSTGAPAALRVGIVGTGEMGRPLVDRLLAAGHAVAAYARRPEARAELAAAGVEVVGSVRALGATRDVVLIYVYSDEQVRTVALDDGLVDAMMAGTLLVIHTTGSPATAQAIDARAGARGVDVIDAPGSGGPATVADGTLNLFVGGDEDAVERARALFAAYTSTVTHFGALGTGQIVKLINNLLFGAHVELAIEASRLSSAFGIDPATLARTLHTCSGQSFSLDLVAAMGSPETLVAGAGRFIHKDVLVASEVAAGIGAELGTFAAVTAPLLERTRPREPPTPTREGPPR
jgi:3-hydroxyisobutyrate dehydrogenase-like beta-hydroxyacid dehydrogenase